MLVLVAQGVHDVGDARLQLHMLAPRVPVDVKLGVEGRVSNLRVQLLTPHRLCNFRHVRIERQALPRQEVGKCDNGLTVRQLEVGLVQLEEETPELLLGVHRPHAVGVEFRLRVREGVLLVILGVVPGEQRHNVAVLTDRRREDVHLQLVAGLEDGVELGQGVGEAVALRRVDPELVVARGEEDAPELRLQGLEAADQRHEGVRDVARHDQHVLLELEFVDVVHPLIIALVVEVQVRHRKHLRGALRAMLVDAEARAQPRHGRDRPPERHQREARRPRLLQLGVLRRRPDAEGELGVGLLALADPQQRRA
mmetsp:Transcript_2984/g.7766  ORF Transcript_2984/g.7766 Transcript_2984/m.7766 type:complete len:310 (-) Transcript_2984:1406-2335(-)